MATPNPIIAAKIHSSLGCGIGTGGAGGAGGGSSGGGSSGGGSWGAAETGAVDSSNVTGTDQDNLRPSSSSDPGR